MSLIKMKSKKAMDLPGWGYVIALIIGLFVIGLIVWVTIKSGGNMRNWLDVLKGAFGL